MRGAFTLLEIIFVIFISAILSIASFKAIEAIYLKTAKAKAITELSLESQIILDELSTLIYNRIPNSVIGYSPNDGSCESIYALTEAHPVLEWLSTMERANIQRVYDGFVDMNSSDASTKSLKTNHLDKSLDVTDVAVVFAGAFDDGESDISACNGAYGWHGNDSNNSFAVDSVDTDSITLKEKPKYIYEKYYLTKSAYAVTRGENIKDITPCGVHESDFKDFNNTLFLFYDYHPYEGQTYCGDGGVGKVAVLGEDVSGFRVNIVNDTIGLSIDMNRKIRGGLAVHITKQKALF